MAENSKIEWTHHTFNPWRGCTKVSDGCKNCYAEQLSGRNHATLGTWGPKGERVIAAESYWRQPARWNRDAEQAEERRRVFCASLADVFEGRDTMPATSWQAIEEARWRLFGVIQNTPHLDWLLLTKRPQSIMPMLRAMPLARGNPGGPSLADCMPFANVWFGTSIEDQAAASERIPHLLHVPAVVRFLSCEPLLGPVDLNDMSRTPGAGDEITEEDDACGPPLDGVGGIDWVICGGESGPGARPMHPDWGRSLRDQCASARVPFLFKQWGDWWPCFGTDDDMAEIYMFADGYESTSDHGRPPASVPALPEKTDYRYHQWDGYLFAEPDPTDGTSMFHSYRVGKKAAGRLLDGRLHDEYPSGGR